MNKKLSVLVVEDSEADAELVRYELVQGGFDPVCERVATRPAMAAALDNHSWDVVLADYSMPGFSGKAALELLLERELEIPFISVSGTMGEDVAVAMMKAGAHDYVTKNDLKRLVPAIERELKATELRRRQKQAEESIQLLAAIVESTDDAIVSETLGGMILSWNRGAERIYGYTAEEMIGRPVSMLIPPDRPNELAYIIDKIKNGEHVVHHETIRVCKNGECIHVSLTVSPVRDARGEIIAASAIARNVTDRVNEERERVKLIGELTDALNHVHVLKGLLPICAACKKIRDDRGYWQQVETYIEQRTDAHFTHGICPDCMTRLYPEYITSK